MRYPLIRVFALGALAVASASCGSIARQGRSPAYLVVDSVSGAEGLASPVPSDVVTNVTSPAPCTPATPCETIINDLGEAVLRAEMKDPTLTIDPTPTNDITIFRYHVSYRRSDGRNTEGIDVPFAFDGASTATIRVGGTTTVPFELVRAVAKEETPLVNLRSSASIVTTIADVTFYGRDQAGNTVSVTGLIQVNFGNFAP
jgi:hypothetical protein